MSKAFSSTYLEAHVDVESPALADRSDVDEHQADEDLADVDELIAATDTEPTGLDSDRVLYEMERGAHRQTLDELMAAKDALIDRLQ